MEYNFLNADNARTGLYCDEPGNYLITPSLSNHVTNPNQDLSLRVFISGYGVIDCCKIFVAYPNDILEYSKSSISTDFNISYENGKMNFSFGSNKKQLTPSGLIMSLHGGICPDNWKQDHETFFFDLDGNRAREIATERISMQAPIDFRLTFRDSAKAGIYNFYITMTYFNGKEWKGDRMEIPITVPTLFQRHEVLFTNLALGLAGLSTIFAIIDTSSNHHLSVAYMFFNIALPMALVYIITFLLFKNSKKMISNWKLRVTKIITSERMPFSKLHKKDKPL